MARIKSPLPETENQFKSAMERKTYRTGPNNGRLVAGLRRAGKKIREWERIRAELKKRFQKVGITVCEFAYPKCWHDNALGFAHTKKRRNCSNADLYVVALACSVCHDRIEIKPEAEMQRIVLGVISKRREQP